MAERCLPIGVQQDLHRKLIMGVVMRGPCERCHRTDIVTERDGRHFCARCINQPPRTSLLSKLLGFFQRRPFEHLERMLEEPGSAGKERRLEAQRARRIDGQIDNTGFFQQLAQERQSEHESRLAAIEAWQPNIPSSPVTDEKTTSRRIIIDDAPIAEPMPVSAFSQEILYSDTQPVLRHDPTRSDLA